MSETRTVHDPFFGRDVEVSNRLVDRLRGRYAVGPTLPNGEPEFGWRQHDGLPPIQKEAADEIERLTKQLVTARADAIEEAAKVLDGAAQDWHRIRDPGMANNAKHYAKQIRALTDET